MLSQRNFESTIKSLMTHKKVLAVVIANTEGFVLTSKIKNDLFPQEEIEHIAALFSALLGRTKSSIKKINYGEVEFFTINTTVGEILVALEGDYIVIAIREKKS